MTTLDKRWGKTLAIMTLLVLSTVVVDTPFNEPARFQGIRIISGLINLPGILATVVLGVALSPQGGHGASDFGFVIPMLTWSFYALVSYLYISRQEQRRRVPLDKVEGVVKR